METPNKREEIQKQEIEIIFMSIIAPVERVKILLQTQNVIPRIRSGEVSRFTSISDCFKRTYSEQGLRSFWRGNFCAVICTALPYLFSTSLTLFVSNLIKNNPDNSHFFLLSQVSAFLALPAIMLTIYPFEYARTRLATDVSRGNRNFSGLFNCFSKTIGGPNGFFGLYSGFGSFCTGTIIFAVVYLGVFFPVCIFSTFTNI